MAQRLLGILLHRNVPTALPSHMSVTAGLLAAAAGHHTITLDSGRATI